MSDVLGWKWRTAEEYYASPEHALESIMDGDGEWLVPFAMLVSLAWELYHARCQGFWHDQPSEMEGDFRWVRVGAERNEVRMAHHIWKEYAGEAVDRLCGMVRSASEDRIRPGRGTVLRMAKDKPRSGLTNYTGGTRREVAA